MTWLLQYYHLNISPQGSAVFILLRKDMNPSETGQSSQMIFFDRSDVEQNENSQLNTAQLLKISCHTGTGGLPYDHHSVSCERPHKTSVIGSYVTCILFYGGKKGIYLFVFAQHRVRFYTTAIPSRKDFRERMETFTLRVTLSIHIFF